MYYTADFRKENQSLRFDRWRVNYDLLIRVIEAKEARMLQKTENNSKTISNLSIRKEL